MDEDARRRMHEICKLIGQADCTDETAPIGQRCTPETCYIAELVELGRATRKQE